MGTALGGEARLTTVGRASASCSWPNVAAWTRRSGGGPAARQWKRTRTGDRREGGREGSWCGGVTSAPGHGEKWRRRRLLLVLRVGDTREVFASESWSLFRLSCCRRLLSRFAFSSLLSKTKKGKKKRGLHLSSARASNIFVQLSVLSEGKST